MDLITPDFGIIFWQTVTLLVVLIVLRKFAWKPILQMLNEREGYIRSSLGEAQEANQILKQMKADQSQLLENSNREREKLVNEALATKNDILVSASLEAKQLGQKLLKETKEAIEIEKKMAFDKLKNEVALLSVQVAEKLLVRELNSTNKQEELVQSLIRETSLH